MRPPKTPFRRDNHLVAGLNQVDETGLHADGAGSGLAKVTSLRVWNATEATP